MTLTRIQVAKAAHVNVETIRYHMQRGLIPEPPRSESGYRLFTIDTVQRVHFIKRAQELGFTLDEILLLLRISDERDNHDAVEIQNITENKIKEIELKIRDLTKMKRALKELAIKCPGEGHSVHDCPIIKSISGEK